MGNSGKLAVVAAGVSVGLLVLLSITLEEIALFAFLAAVGIGYVACIAEVFARRRYFVALLGCVGSTLCVAFAIAFLRMWGIAFNQDGNALGTAVSTQDSDIYFYLAVAAGFGTLIALFAGAVLPGRRVAPAAKGMRPAARPRTTGTKGAQPRAKGSTAGAKSGAQTRRQATARGLTTRSSTPRTANQRAGAQRAGSRTTSKPR